MAPGAALAVVDDSVARAAGGGCARAGGAAAVVSGRRRAHRPGAVTAAFDDPRSPRAAAGDRGDSVAAAGADAARRGSVGRGDGHGAPVAGAMGFAARAVGVAGAVVARPVIGRAAGV